MAAKEEAPEEGGGQVAGSAGMGAVEAETEEGARVGVLGAGGSEGGSAAGREGGRVGEGSEGGLAAGMEAGTVGVRAAGWAAAGWEGAGSVEPA